MKAGRDIHTNNPWPLLLLAIAAIVGLIYLYNSAIFPPLNQLVNTLTGRQQASEVPESPPSATIIALCHFAKLNRSDWIYQIYTTESFQKEVSGPQFTGQWNGMGFNDQCTLSNVEKSGDVAVGALTVERLGGVVIGETGPQQSEKTTGTFNYRVTFKKQLSQDSDGKPAYVWMIDKIESN
jgi:hypothetical protein